jgi:hypothetical protein
MDVADGLASFGACIEDDAVAALRDALADGHLMGMLDKVSEQVIASGRQLSEVGVVVTRNHEDVDWGLRIDIPEGDSARVARHDRRWNFGGRNAAEQAVRHQKILTCTGLTGPLTYMVALRTHGAPPPRCNGPASFWLSVAQGSSHSRARMRSHRGRRG